MSSSKYVFSDAERYGVCRAHGYRCFWCDKPVPFRHATIDHLVPEHLEGDTAKLQQVLAGYSLPATFKINDFPNWVPAHQKCNSRKGTSILVLSPAMQLAFSRAEKCAAKARRFTEQIEREPDKAKALASVDTWVREEVLTVSALVEVAGRHGKRLVEAIGDLQLVGAAIGASARAGTSDAGDDDPFAKEIDVYRSLTDRFLYREALEGLQELRKKCGDGPGLSRSRFRIANNTGVCLMGLHRYDEARTEFERALAIEPANDLARVNLAASLLLGDKPEEALAKLADPVADESMRGKAGALRIGALHAVGRQVEIDAFLPSETWSARDPHVQLALAKVLYASGEDDIDDHLRVALDAHETALDAHAFAGMRALHVGRQEGADGFLRVDDDLPDADLTSALAYFRKAIDSCPAAARDLRAELHGNCGLVLAMLDRPDEALSEFGEARTLWMRPQLSVIGNHASLLMKRGEFADAARNLRESGFVELNGHIRVQLGAALYGMKAHAEVVDLLATSWPSVSRVEDRVRGGAMVMDAFRRLGRQDEAGQVCEALVRDHGDGWETWFHVGRHFAELDARAKAVEAYGRALSLASGGGSADVREELGYRQAVWGDHAAAVATLEPLDPAGMDDPAAQALVVSLYNLGEYARARSASDVLLARERVPMQVLEVAVAVASLAGDLDRAENLQARLLREHRPRLHDVSGMARLQLRRGDRGAAARTLAVDPLQMEGGDDAHDLMVFAHLLSAIKDPRALQFAYRSWERGQDQPQILLGYIGVFLHRERAHDDALEAEVVAPGTTVTMEVPGKSSKRVVSILRDGDAVMDPSTWVKPTDPLARRLLGRRVGDEVPGPSTPLGQTSHTVVEVKSNYVRAFQETMAGFNERFPDAEGLWKFEFKQDDLSEITRVLMAVAGNRGHVRQLIEQHTKGALPISALAGALHRSIPVIWSALVHDREFGGAVAFSRGATLEVGVAEELLGDGKRPVYLDYTALMTLSLLRKELRDKLCGVLPRPRVLQSLLDDLHEHTLKATPMGSGDGFSVSVDDDGKLRGSPRGDEHGFLVEIEAIARAAATPTPAYSALESKAERDVATKVLGKPTADLLWEASKAGGVLLCDDQALADLARLQNGTPAVSVQAVALAASRKGLITLPEYGDVVQQLASARYRFVSLTADVVEAILQRNEWQATEGVLAVLSCLEGQPGDAFHCSTESAANVSGDVLARIMLGPVRGFLREALVDAVLGRVTVGHDLRAILSLIDKSARGRLATFAPIQMTMLRKTLNAWFLARRQ